MQGIKISAEKEKEVIELLEQGGITRDDIAIRAGVAGSTVTKIKAKMRATCTGSPKAEEAQSQRKPTETIEMVGDKMTITKVSRISDLEGLIAHFKVDREIWEVERWKANKWDMGMKPAATTEYITTEDGRTIPAWVRFEKEPIVTELYQVTATFVKKIAIANARAEIELLRKEALKYSPKFTGFKPRKPAGSGVAAEMYNTDHHTAALIDAEETGGDPWDMKLSAEAWRDSFSTLCSRVDGYKPDLAVLPMGSDQMNFDNTDGSTTKLTPQSNAARYHRAYEQVKKDSKFAIDMAIQKYGRVLVPIVPGNHDMLTAWHLGDYLTTWYRNCPGVTINNAPQLRKWWEYGVVMVMWEHGDKGKVPDYGKIMSAKMPEMWGRTKWREAHTAHFHTRRVFEDIGYTVRGFPSLRPSCAWGVANHHDGAIRASEALVWSKTEGLIGQATYSILRKGEGAQ